MQAFWEKITGVIATNIPRFTFGILVLVAAIIVASLARLLIQKLLDKTQLDEKLGAWVSGGGEGKEPVRLDKWIGRAVFWLVLLYGLVLFFEQLGLTTSIKPLNALLEKIAAYLPNLGGALLLCVVAWMVATGLRFVVVRSLERTKLDEKLKAAEADVSEASVAQSLGNAMFALVWLLFLVPILETLKLEALLTPLQAMLEKVFAFFPRLLGAAAILLIGWFVARLLRRLVSSLCTASGLDGLGERTGLGKIGKGSLSDLVGTVVYVLLLLSVLAMALESLELKVVADPLTGVLGTVTAIVPQLLGSALILVVAWIGGRLLGSLVADLLARIGFDRLLVVLGLTRAEDAADDAGEASDRRTPSWVVGQVVLFAVMIFAVSAALEQVGFIAVQDTLMLFIARAGEWLIALVFFALGLWLANFVARAIRARETQSSNTLALVTKGAIIVLAAAMSLEKLGVGEEIVQMAFGIPLAGIALGGALAFGFGGRDAAGQQITEWKSRDESQNDE